MVRNYIVLVILTEIKVMPCRLKGHRESNRKLAFCNISKTQVFNKHNGCRVE